MSLFYCYAEHHYVVSFWLSILMLSVISAECPFYIVMICAIMANVIVVNIVMLNAIYADCHFLLLC